MIRPSKQLALICAGMALIGVCYGFARFAYGLFAPLLQEEFDLDSALLGVISAGSYLGYVLAIVASFILTNRYGARAVAVSAAAVAALGTLLVAVSTTGLMLAVGILIAGSSTGLASPPMAAAIARAVEPSKQDRAQSIVNAGTGVGVLLSGPVSILLMGNWRWAWCAFAAICLLVAWWIAVTVPQVPAASWTSTSASLLPAGTATLMAAALLMGMTSAAVWTFGRDVVTTRGGLGPTTSTVMWTVIGLAGMLGAFSGHLTGGLGLRRSWTLVMGLLSSATVALVLVASMPVVAYLAAGVFGASYIALCGLVLVWSTRVYQGRPATGVGASFMTIAVGQAIGAPVVGVLIDRLDYVTAFGVCALLGFVGSAVRPAKLARDRAPAGV